MRTRTLLLLAVACGLAILLAGSIQLLRLTGDGAGSDDLGVGDRAVAGDLRVTVERAAESDGVMRIALRLSGVDDPGGLDGFRLVVPGAALVPLAPADAGEGACVALTVAEQRCTLVFETVATEGSARVLLLRRGEDQQRWTLA